MNREIKTIAIAGGGTAGWMTAAAFSKAFKNDLYRIILIESDDIGTVGVGEATIPSISLFNNLVGINEFEFLKFCKGSYKYGIEFEGWSTLDSCYMHPFGQYGKSIQNLQFHHYWRKLFDLGKAKPLSEYALSIRAAYQNKFAKPANIKDSPLNSLSHAYHMDAGLYAQMLRKISERQGVERIEDKIENVVVDDTNGNISRLQLAKYGEVNADFYIDCTGFRSLLLGKTLQVPYVDWSHFLPCDRAITVATEKLNPLPPYTQAKALEAGWKWRIPLQHRTGNGYVYSSAFSSESQAESRLLEHCPQVLPGAEPKLIKFTTGMRKSFWDKNCVAIGLSSGFMEPLESTSIFLIQSAISKLLALFPSSGSDSWEPEQNKFNEQLTYEFEYIRDFLILHYKATERDDSEFWKYCKNMDIPARLTEKIDLYKNGGRIFRENGELFGEISWLAVMEGQGIKAQGYNSMVDAFSTETIEKLLSQFDEVIGNSLNVMAPHGEFIEKYCKASSM